MCATVHAGYVFYSALVNLIYFRGILIHMYMSTIQVRVVR